MERFQITQLEYDVILHVSKISSSFSLYMKFLNKKQFWPVFIEQLVMQHVRCFFKD